MGCIIRVRSSGTAPNFLITFASPKSPVAGSPVRLNATAPTCPGLRDRASARMTTATGLKHSVGLRCAPAHMPHFHFCFSKDPRSSRAQGIQTRPAASPRLPAKGGTPRAEPRRSAFGASLLLPVLPTARGAATTRESQHADVNAALACEFRANWRNPKSLQRSPHHAP
jgi:hypothetical protein